MKTLLAGPSPIKRLPSPLCIDVVEGGRCCPNVKMIEPEMFSISTSLGSIEDKGLGIRGHMNDMRAY